MNGGRVLLQVNRRLEKELREVGGVTKPEMLNGAKTMKRALKKMLGVKGNGKPSKPGEPPRKQKGELEKSVISGPVGTVQRIGLTKFTATLLEFGVDTRADKANPRSRKGAVNDASRRAAARRSERRTKGGDTKVRKTKIDPRPFMDKAIALAEKRMVDDAVSSIRRRLPGGF